MRIVFDLEIYQNYFLATFVCEDGTVVEFERFNNLDTENLRGLALWLQPHTLVSFNGRRYDMPLLSLAINGADNAMLKEASDHIIVDEWMWWILEDHYNFMTLDIDHIDIINLLPLYASLKLYGARTGTQKLQDLPYDPATTVDEEMTEVLRVYCRNDCQITWERFVGLWDVIQLRMTMGEAYGIDLRSKSDAQIAEAVMISEYKKITGIRLVKPIDAGPLPTEVPYITPDWVRGDMPTRFSQMLELEPFQLNSKNGKPIAPDWLAGKVVEIDDKPYKVGLGGLHAKNKSESYYSVGGKRILEIDVTSFYPRTILNNGYAPPHMGGTFTRIYESLVEQRLKAKAACDETTAEALKITINGTYGKLGSRYSAVYAPELLLGVTFTGQLAILMLLEMMAEKGIQCLSANTDSVTIMAENDDFGDVLCDWEDETGFNLEVTQYKSIHYRDCNNYFALTNDGKLKRKGVFKTMGVDKNPSTPIVFKAVMDYVLYGKSITGTIAVCTDVTQFLSVRTVKGGAAKDSEYLGKAIRWYYSTETDTAIHYISNGNKVAKTDGAMPMMDLIPGLPRDLDWQWYINEAEETLSLIGYESWM